MAGLLGGLGCQQRLPGETVDGSELEARGGGSDPQGGPSWGGPGGARRSSGCGRPSPQGGWRSGRKRRGRGPGARPVTGGPSEGEQEQQCLAEAMQGEQPPRSCRRPGAAPAPATEAVAAPGSAKAECVSARTSSARPLPAAALTSLHQESVDTQQRSFDPGIQAGCQRRHGDALVWVKNHRTICREDLISLLCGKVPPPRNPIVLPRPQTDCVP